MDDESLLDDAGGLHWSIESGPLSVDPRGLASGVAVYQDTLAVVMAAYGEASGSLPILVINSDPDNFGVYAADGLDDAAQVAYGGSAGWILLEHPEGSGLTDGVTTIDFATLETGTASAPRTFIITNASDAELDLGPIMLDGSHVGDFAVDINGLTNPLPPAESTSFTVTFIPSAGGVRSAEMHLAAAGAPGASFDVGLSGRGNTFPTFSGFSASTPYEQAASISLGKLLQKALDPDGDPLSLSVVGTTSTQGGTVESRSGSILYTPPGGFAGADDFAVTISDPWGGSVTGSVKVTVNSDVGIGTNPPRIELLAGGNVKVLFHGIPGRSYELQRSGDLVAWATIITSAAGVTGGIEFIDESPPPGSQFYCIRKP